MTLSQFEGLLFSSLDTEVKVKDTWLLVNSTHLNVLNLKVDAKHHANLIAATSKSINSDIN